MLVVELTNTFFHTRKNFCVARGLTFIRLRVFERHLLRSMVVGRSVRSRLVFHCPFRKSPTMTKVIHVNHRHQKVMDYGHEEENKQLSWIKRASC